MIQRWCVRRPPAADAPCFIRRLDGPVKTHYSRCHNRRPDTAYSSMLKVGLRKASSSERSSARSPVWKLRASTYTDPFSGIMISAYDPEHQALCTIELRHDAFATWNSINDTNMELGLNIPIRQGILHTALDDQYLMLLQENDSRTLTVVFRFAAHTDACLPSVYELPLGCTIMWSQSKSWALYLPKLHGSAVCHRCSPKPLLRSYP